MCFVSKNLVDDMRCPRNTFLKHFVMPDEDLKKKGYTVDVLDESKCLEMKVCICNIFLWTKNASRFLRFYSILKILGWSKKEYLMLFMNA